MTASIGLTVSVADTLKELTRLTRAVNPITLLKATAYAQMSWIDRNFRAQGALGPSRWKPLSPNTVYARRQGSSEPLQDTGKLRQSFTRGNPLRLTSEEVEVGTNLEYAIFHEEGTKPHWIFPRNKKALAFPGVSGPVILKGTAIPSYRGKHGWIVRGVHHPGFPARPMLPSATQTIEMFEAVFEAAVGRGA